MFKIIPVEQSKRGWKDLTKYGKGLTISRNEPSLKEIKMLG